MKTRKVDVVDDFHGTKVADPYRWLEDAESDEVRAWDDAQNERTRAYVDATGKVDALKARITELLSIGFASAPAIRVKRDGTRRYFQQRRTATQNQPVLYVRDGAHGEPRVLLDPAPLSPDGTTAVDWWYPSDDGALLAWGRSEAGSEDSTLYVRDVDSGEDRDLAIPYTRHASVAWLPDGSGFFYTRHPKPGAVPAGDEVFHCHVFFHRLGDDPANDKDLFGEGRDKLDMPSVALSPSGRWLVVRVHRGWDKSDVYVRDRAAGDDAPFVAVAEGKYALFEPIALDDALYLMTNDGAPRYRLYAVDWGRFDRGDWRELLPESADVLTDLAILKTEIVAAYMHDASTRILRFDKTTAAARGEIALPSLGSGTINGRHDDDELFVGFTTFTTPYEVIRHATVGGAGEVWDRVGEGVKLPEVDVRMLHATSRDGTRVPMFVVEKRGASLASAASPRPACLYGYGGFNLSQTPAFSARVLTFVERGGVWATAVLRGGGEFGEAWHRAGMLEKKQNVFDDVIACAEKLCADGVTAPDRLAIMGGSNGGLLVAAAVTQRPDLFRVGLSFVPLTDMLRYHRFRIGSLWIPEYGSPDDPAEFAFLYAYSPYHRVKDGQRYPAMLFTTAESDSRVDPMHARKMAARMQDAVGAVGEGSARPVLLRVERRAGHGAGKPIAKVIDELSDELAFLAHEIGLDVSLEK